MSAPFLLLMPSYNQSHYIVEAVRSVLAQDDPNWELWIVDNSSDNTPEVMRDFVDRRIRFTHIPARMDPGSCLNWMLERASGRDFSYVHTDNNLHPAYVRRMRKALAEHPLALSYCDMRTIDKSGRFLNVYKRGRFDLARLLSVDSLGVPFAATTELAKRMGGFSSKDFADDVRFCVSAYGLAHYVYVPDALVDYRLHRGSRTEGAGGSEQIQRIFVELMPKIVPLLEERAVRPVAALETAIQDALGDIDLWVENIWYRNFARFLPVWWNGYPRAGDFFFTGLLTVRGFSSRLGRPKLQWKFQKDNKTVLAWPWAILAAKIYLYVRRRDIQKILRETAFMLVTWAAITLAKSTPATAVRFRILNLDFRTVWAARQLELLLGWVPLLDIAVGTAPSWLRWGRAEGTEPVLDCAANISLVCEASKKRV